MVVGARVSPLRNILEQRFSQISSELEAAVEQLVADAAKQTQERARGEFADWMNQAARRLRQAGSATELGTALLETAGAFADGAALLAVNEKRLRGERVRGASRDQAETFPGTEIPMEHAPALAQAVSTQDPITTLISPGEISHPLAALAAGSSDGRAQIYPVVTGERVPALLFAWGVAQAAAIELLVQVASAVWGALPSSAGFVSIVSPAKVASSWESLPPEEQKVHLRAQRFARVQVAEIRLYETDAVQAGRAHRDLYGMLRSRIDAARESFHKSFFETCPSMVDYLHLELVRTLASDDAELLGKDYPGPLV